MSDSAEAWHTANETGCRALDTRAHLAAITYDNNAFLSKQVELFTPDFYWVGLRSSDDEWNKGTEYATKVEDGSFTWASLGYSNPSHAGDPEWDCVIADAEGWKDGEWCSSKFASLCQLDQVRHLARVPMVFPFSRAPRLASFALHIEQEHATAILVQFTAHISL